MAMTPPVTFRKKIGFWIGVILFLAMMWLPSFEGLSAHGQRAAAVAILMAVWWISESLPMGVVSILPLALYPVFSILSMEETAKRYADPNVFLFLGGFLMALAMQKARLHERIALLTIQWVGHGPRRVLGGFMLVTAFVSLWMSNTTATLMMLPIAMAVIGHLGRKRVRPDLNIALLLGIAYASSIGGVATLIGKPTNMIFIGQAKNLLPHLPEVSFIQWSLFGFPVAAGFLLVTWIFLSFVLIRDNTTDSDFKMTLSKEVAALGPLRAEEKRVSLIFLVTLLAWFWRPDLRLGPLEIPGWSTVLGLKDVHDGTIAMAAALVFFLTPSGHGKGRLLNLEWARRVPWDVLLLLGAGFALAESFSVSGLALWTAGGFQVFKGVPLPVLLLAVCLLTSFMSELMSNTAQVAMMMPILASAATMLGIHPYLVMIPATIAASFAFMMPVGTPPNAIVFATGHVKMPQMAKTGFILNILGALWITGISLLLLKPALGI